MIECKTTLNRGLKIRGLQGCMRLVENLFAAYVAFLSVRLTPTQSYLSFTTPLPNVTCQPMGSYLPCTRPDA